MAAGAHRAGRAVVLMPSRDAALPADSELCECTIRVVLLLPYPDRHLRLRLAGQGTPRCQLLCLPCFFLVGMGPMDVLLDRGSRPPGHRGADEHGRRDQKRAVHQKILVLGCLVVMVAYLWATWSNMVVVPVAQNNATY